MTTPQLKKVAKIITPTAESMGYEIVRIMMVGAGSSKPTLQIMAEKPDGTMHVDDCGRLSQAVSALLDVEDVIQEAYYLEVSSPGIDRPLTRPKDFENYKNQEARVEVETPINGQKKFKGMLRGLDGDDVVIESESGEIQKIPFRDVVRSKLLLTDELIKLATKKDKQASKEKKKQKKSGKK